MKQFAPVNMRFGVEKIQKFTLTCQQYVLCWLPGSRSLARSSHLSCWLARQSLPSRLVAVDVSCCFSPLIYGMI